MLSRGLVQIYTGDGKGKTTAAIGQAFRSVGRGLRVYMVQFLKSSDTGELHSVKRLYPEFQIFRMESIKGFFWTLNDQEKQVLKEEVLMELDFCRKALRENLCDILIMDEVMGAIGNGLIDTRDVLELIKSKPTDIEIIMTGRNAPEELMDAADLVTEMREMKHYYQQGIGQRKGIEF